MASKLEVSRLDSGSVNGVLYEKDPGRSNLLNQQNRWQHAQSQLCSISHHRTRAEMRLRASIVVDETASLSEVKLEAGLQ